MIDDWFKFLCLGCRVIGGFVKGKCGWIDGFGKVGYRVRVFKRYIG